MLMMIIMNFVHVKQNEIKLLHCIKAHFGAATTDCHYVNDARVAANFVSFFIFHLLLDVAIFFLLAPSRWCTFSHIPSKHSIW